MDFTSAIVAFFLSLFGFTSDQALTDVPPTVAPSATETAIDRDDSINLNPTEEMIGDEPKFNDGDKSPVPVASGSKNGVTMLVAGGCFWCVEADLEKTPGVIDAVSGYAGGTTENPSYKDYSQNGHREVVLTTYDPSQISFEDILIVTLKNTDPTDDDGTFYDRGDNYSAAFYFENDEQKNIINNLIAEIDTHGPYKKQLAIDVAERPEFYPAEDFHQDYYKGTLSKFKYKHYRNASGRDDFIAEHWGNNRGPLLPWRQDNDTSLNSTNQTNNHWQLYVKPSKDELRQTLSPLAFNVTQESGTERAHTSPLNKVYERGIYVDILSGEPLYSSRDKFDSHTGWPSFTKSIMPGAVTEHEDHKLFFKRIEVRSVIADNHLGHIFNDGPPERGGLRHCINGVALRFVPEADMVLEGYGDFLVTLD